MKGRNAITLGMLYDKKMRLEQLEELEKKITNAKIEDRRYFEKIVTFYPTQTLK